MISNRQFLRHIAPRRIAGGQGFNPVKKIGAQCLPTQCVMAGFQSRQKVGAQRLPLGGLIAEPRFASRFRAAQISNRQLSARLENAPNPQKTKAGREF
jgi:hypothetical protein